MPGSAKRAGQAAFLGLVARCSPVVPPGPGCSTFPETWGQLGREGPRALSGMVTLETGDPASHLLKPRTGNLPKSHLKP